MPITKTKPVSHASLKRLVKIASTPGSCSYASGEENKAFFHRVGQRVLRQLADELGLVAGTYDIRSNKGGIAVSGEVTLHSETMYIQLSQSVISSMGVLVRTCQGRKDYTGGPNNFVDWASFLDIDSVAVTIRRKLGVS